MDLNDVAYVIEGKIQTENIGDVYETHRVSLLGPNGKPARVPSPMNPEHWMDVVATRQGPESKRTAKRQITDLVRGQLLSYGLRLGESQVIHVPPDIKDE